jgi:hypothetical protein
VGPQAGKRFSQAHIQARGRADRDRLAAIIVADRARHERRPAVVRALSVALMVVLVAEAAGVTARPVVELVEGGPETNSAKDLLSVGFGVWLYTILAFPPG